MGVLREIAASFGIEWEGSKLEKAVKQVDKVKGSLIVLGGVLAGTGYAVARFATGFEEDAGRLEDTANALNLTTTQLQELEVAGTRAGLSTGQLDSALQRFQGSIEGAAQGSGAGAEAFGKLGIKLKDSSGQVRNTSDVMGDLASAFGRVQDPAQRSHLAIELFGRQGSKLATILHDGQGGLTELRKELGELGGGLTQEAVEAAGHLGDSFDRLKVGTDSLRSAIAVALLPPLTWLVDKTKDSIVWFTKLARSSSLIQAALVTLGVAAGVVGLQMLTAFSPVLVALAPWILGIAAVVLVVDDLITLFRGGKSVIGDFIDSMFGVGASKEFIEGVRVSFEATKLAIHDAQDAVEGFFELFGRKRAQRNQFRSVVDAQAHGFETTSSRDDRATAPRSVTDAAAQGNTEVSHTLETLLASARRGHVAITPEIRDQLAQVALPARPAPQVVHNAPVTVNVNGANRDPAAIAREVVRITEARQADNLARAHAANREHTDS